MNNQKDTNTPKTVQMTLEAQLPELTNASYEYTGEYRVPELGEHIALQNGEVTFYQGSEVKQVGDCSDIYTCFVEKRPVPFLIVRKKIPTGEQLTGCLCGISNEDLETAKHHASELICIQYILGVASEYGDYIDKEGRGWNLEVMSNE